MNGYHPRLQKSHPEGKINRKDRKAALRNSISNFCGLLSFLILTPFLSIKCHSGKKHRTKIKREDRRGEMEENTQFVYVYTWQLSNHNFSSIPVILSLAMSQTDHPIQLFHWIKVMPGSCLSSTKVGGPLTSHWGDHYTIFNQLQMALIVNKCYFWVSVTLQDPMQKSWGVMGKPR